MIRHLASALIAVLIVFGPVLAACYPPMKDRHFLFPDERLD